MPTLAEILADLTQRIARLDEQISAERAATATKVAKREALATTVKMLHEEQDGGACGAKRTASRRTRGKAPDTNQPTADPAPKVRRGRRADSMAAAIRAMVLQLEREFVPSDVKRLVAKNRPEIAAKLAKGFIPSLLWRMCRDGVLIIVKPAENGGSNTYAVKR